MTDPKKAGATPAPPCSCGKRWASEVHDEGCAIVKWADEHGHTRPETRYTPTSSDVAEMAQLLRALAVSLYHPTLNAAADMIERLERENRDETQARIEFEGDANRAEAERDAAIGHLRDAAPEAHAYGLLTDHNDGTSWDQVPFEKCVNADCLARRTFLGRDSGGGQGCTMRWDDGCDGDSGGGQG